MTKYLSLLKVLCAGSITMPNWISNWPNWIITRAPASTPADLEAPWFVPRTIWDKCILNKSTDYLWVRLHEISQKRAVVRFHISPHWTITTGTRGLFDPSVGIFSIFRTISIPSSMTLPNTTCLESKKSHFVQVRKNWQPFVFLPEFADKIYIL